MNLKNKLLISFILFIIFIYCLTGFSSASSYTTIVTNGVREDDTWTINIPLADYNCSYYVIFDNLMTNDNDRAFVCYISSLPLTWKSKYVSKYDNTIYNPVGYSSDDVVLYSSFVATDIEDYTAIFSGFSKPVYGSEYQNYNIMASNYDIYTEEGDLVFQGALSQVVTIPGITQVEEIPQVMEQVMTILIPIGLIVFSIGLVIYLTRLVISRVQ